MKSEGGKEQEPDENKENIKKKDDEEVARKEPRTKRWTTRMIREDEEAGFRPAFTALHMSLSYVPCFYRLL